MKDKALVAFSDTIITSALDRIRDVLESGWIAAGKNAREYEAHLARLAHRRHAVATSSATAAYEVGMRALGLRDGQMVFAANSFVGMPLLCARFDLEPVFCDVTVEAGMAPTWEQVAAVLTERTVAVCLTQLGGFVARDAPRIEQECRQRGIILIEDCTHALGASYQQRYAGSFGDFSFASTQATKVFSTGEGGGLLTDREDVVQRARELMTFGSRERVSGGPIAYEEGYAWRASELAAALGAAVFAEADDILARRRQLAHTYDRLWEQANLDQFGLRRAPVPDGCDPVWLRYVFLLPSDLPRQPLKDALFARGFRLDGELWSLPVPRHPVWQGCYEHLAFPGATYFTNHHACLPLGLRLETTDQEALMEALYDILRHRAWTA
ncbi:MAG: DegT/DnrJ/EryC1/StrS family aminotransferase [Ardenticatenales bacterium]|nr:DegT/DnrJ/EryC1/StrS family aminotransferase [Ardenticatenales bacterium]